MHRGARDHRARGCPRCSADPIAVRFDRVEQDGPPPPARPSANAVAEALAADPWVQDVMKTFETAPFPYRVDGEDDSSAR